MKSIKYKLLKSILGKHFIVLVPSNIIDGEVKVYSAGVIPDKFAPLVRQLADELEKEINFKNPATE